MRLFQCGVDAFAGLDGRLSRMRQKLSVLRGRPASRDIMAATSDLVEAIQPRINLAAQGNMLDVQQAQLRRALRVRDAVWQEAQKALKQRDAAVLATRRILQEGKRTLSQLKKSTGLLKATQSQAVKQNIDVVKSSNGAVCGMVE